MEDKIDTFQHNFEAKGSLAKVIFINNSFMIYRCGEVIYGRMPKDFTKVDDIDSDGRGNIYVSNGTQRYTINPFDCSFQKSVFRPPSKHIYMTTKISEDDDIDVDCLSGTLNPYSTESYATVNFVDPDKMVKDVSDPRVGKQHKNHRYPANMDVRFTPSKIWSDNLAVWASGEMIRNGVLANVDKELFDNSWKQL